MLTLQQQITLKELLKSSNITQIQLANRLKTSRTYLSELLNKPIGNVSWSMIQRICTELGYNASILITC